MAGERIPEQSPKPLSVQLFEQALGRHAVTAEALAYAKATEAKARDELASTALEMTDQRITIYNCEPLYYLKPVPYLLGRAGLQRWRTEAEPIRHENPDALPKDFVRYFVLGADALGLHIGTMQLKDYTIANRRGFKGYLLSYDALRTAKIQARR